MKRIFTLLLLLGPCFAGFSQEKKPKKEMQREIPPVAASGTDSSIVLLESEFDFGKIPQGKPVTHYFTIKNTSDKGILFENVAASCGCTTPEWPKDMIQPNQTAQIKVGYNAAAEGNFTKTVTLTYNSGKTRIITIKGEVWKTPSTSAPLNTALETLKTQ
jgi:hypothetical protein